MKMRLSLAAASAAAFLIAGAAALAETAASPAPAGKININQASAAQLAYLPRIGARAAERIAEYRKENGPFARPEELMEVKGIGEKLFLVLKPYVAISGPTTVGAKIRSTSSRPRARQGSDSKAATSTSPGKGR